jgi:hypothetical protein
VREELTLTRIPRASLLDDLRVESDGAGVSWYGSGLFRSAHDSSRLLRRISGL